MASFPGRLAWGCSRGDRALIRTALVAGVGRALLLVAGVLGAVEASRALDLEGPLTDPDPQGAPRPADTVAALWSGPLAEPELAPGVRKGLDHHPALVAAAAARPAQGSAAGHAGLAAVAIAPELDAAVAARLRLSAAERAWALEPALADAAAVHCPDPVVGLLCEPTGRAVVEAQVDAVLAPVLLDASPVLASAALDAACGLGPDRVAGLLEGLGAPRDARGRSVRLRLLACGERAAALPELQDAAGGDGPEAAVAVLELRRLGIAPVGVVPGTPAAVAAAVP